MHLSEEDKCLFQKGLTIEKYNYTYAANFPVFCSYCLLKCYEKDVDSQTIMTFNALTNVYQLIVNYKQNPLQNLKPWTDPEAPGRNEAWQAEEQTWKENGGQQVDLGV